jgi:hypothetical protein
MSESPLEPPPVNHNAPVGGRVPEDGIYEAVLKRDGTTIKKLPYCRGDHFVGIAGYHDRDIKWSDRPVRTRACPHPVDTIAST